jgi:RNA polymerase sigma-70 factor (ECF subfamily)
MLNQQLHEQPAGDEELFLLSLKQPSAFGSIVDRYHQAFLRKAMAILKNKDDAEDVVQETFVKMYRYGHSYVPHQGASFSSWAYRILLNTCYTFYTKRRKYQTDEYIDEDVHEMLSVADTAFEQMTTLDEVVSILKKIPKALASILTQHVIDGKSYEDIAALEGISVGAVRVRIHRAKEACKKVV